MTISIKTLKLIYITICVATASIIYFVMQSSESVLPSIEQKMDTSFNTNNYNTMQIDSFVMLVEKTFSTNASVQKSNKQLIITIKGEQLSKEFYNGNDALLKYSLKDFGFEIEYVESTKNTIATFNIKDNGVNIPNDILLKLTDKYFAKTKA